MKLQGDKTMPLKPLTMELPARQFIDKDADMRDGFMLKACGLILHTDNSPEAKITGKVYTVVFIDPWGDVSCESRSDDDVDVLPMDDNDALNLLYAINRFWK